MCQTPIDVVACQLISGQAFPELVVKALLYPGAIKTSFMEGTTIPSPDQLLRPYKSNKRGARFTTDLRHLEVIAGSYLCVAGALLGLIIDGVMFNVGFHKQVEGILDSNHKLGKIFCNVQVFVTEACELGGLQIEVVSFVHLFKFLNPVVAEVQCVTNLFVDHECLSQGKKNPALLRLPSSIIPPAEGSDNPADNNRSPLSNISSLDRSFSIHQDNSIGIIGDPSLTKEFLSLERSSSGFLSGKTEGLYTDHSLLVENLRRKRVFLENSGVCCTVMPCHILHSWHDEIKEGCSVPFLNVGECVAKELKEAKLRPLEAGSPPRIGVLATNGTLVARFYQEKLENEGFEVILPDKATVEHTVIPAVEALKRKDFEGAQNLFRIALQVLLVRAVNRVILASDELQELLPTDDPLWGKCINPMDALARSSIKYAQSARRSN
ncbi:UNVERIFIED_CONTAM: hypothetical protein Slati_3364300 [Sesamum latifolium]|uniref:Aspartate racemase n=1 Tax=Sesamum latifolium TaxID=2727402 RepID=A0AAW2UEF9_9LAMI